MSDDTNKHLNNVVPIDEQALQGHLNKVVLKTVEDTLNQILDAEADALVGADRYARTETRKDDRSGSYTRKLHTRARELELKMQKLRKQTFEMAIIERYRHRVASVEEALIEMYLAGVSVQRVEDITAALWGTRVSLGIISKLNQRIYGQIEEWRNRPIGSDFPYVYLDGVVLKRSWGGAVKNVSVLVAIGVGDDGYRRIPGIVEGTKEDKVGWSGFLRHLQARGLKGIRLVLSDACLGRKESIGDFYPEAKWQRCIVHCYRNVFSHVSRGRVKEVSRMLQAIHASEDLESARHKATEVEKKLRDMKLLSATDWLDQCVEETLTYYRFLAEHWIRIRTNNPLERIIREIRRRT